MYWNMKLTDKRFWIWWAIIALMPVFMGVFAVLVMPPAFRISHSAALDLFLVWEIACLAGGWRSYREIQGKGWMASSLVCWTKICPLLVVLSVLLAVIRMHDGFEGLLSFMVSCISWGVGIIPLLLGVYLYKRYCSMV